MFTGCVELELVDGPRLSLLDPPVLASGTSFMAQSNLLSTAPVQIFALCQPVTVALYHQLRPLPVPVSRKTNAPPRRPLCCPAIVSRLTCASGNRTVPTSHLIVAVLWLTANLPRTEEFKLVVHASTRQHSFWATDVGQLLSLR